MLDRVRLPALLALAVLLCLAAPARAQTTVHSQGFNSSLSPWTEVLPTDTTADWDTTSSGSNPACSPHEGAKMAWFNSYNASSGDYAWIYSGNLDLSGAEVAEVRLWMYRNSGSSGAADTLQLLYSTDGNTFYPWAQWTRYSATPGWEEKVVPIGYFAGRAQFRIGLLGDSAYGNNIFVDDLRVLKDTLDPRADGKACASDADCDSGQCGHDPAGSRYCRPVGSACVDGNRVGVAQGTVTCHGPDQATCSGTDTWSSADCFRECGAYVDQDACVLGQCVGCVEECDPFTDEGCSAEGYCFFQFFPPILECRAKQPSGQACDGAYMCLSDNCVPSPGGARFCEPAGTPCAAADGSPVGLGAATCQGSDRYVCQAGGWQPQDCYRNCGFYDDVDTCAGGVCAQCATSCDGNEDCKTGILCQANVCVGDLPLGSTCQLGTQCASDQCVDGRCCQDVCSAPCHRCDLDGSGVCKPILAGGDPDGECAGDGLCGGACNGAGGCQFPPGSTVCDACARCDGRGACAAYVEAGTDPADECPACQACSGGPGGCAAAADGQDPLGDCGESPADGCGLDGACNGEGACRAWLEGTPCGASSCAGGVEQLPDSCDGQGLCVNRGSRACGLYRCADAERCATACSTHASCVSAAFCAADGSCQPDREAGESCAGLVFAGQVTSAACTSGYCFPDNFDAAGEFCASGPTRCVHDGVEFAAGDALCAGDDAYRLCRGGALGWGDEVSCAPGFCDAGGGAGSGHREPGACLSGPGGGCATACTSCEPYLAESEFSCRSACTGPEHCWPDYDCRDGLCQLPEGIGDLCDTQADCRSGVCVDNRCCAEDCTGDCRACNLPDREGLCTPVAADSDPDGDCPTQPADSCGTTGVCDGQGACAHWPAAQVCAPGRCEGSTLLGPSQCDGQGACAPGAGTECAPGRCEGLACRTDCSSHAECDAAGFCGLAGTCQPDLADLAACADVVLPGQPRDPACLSGRCAEDALGGSWICISGVDTCAALGQAYPPGYRLCEGQAGYRVCLGGAEGWSALSACPGATVCNAGGGQGSGVRPQATCSSGPLGGCQAACQSCYPYLASAPGVCLARCTGDGECWPGLTCESEVCVRRAGLGEGCATTADCAYGSCADGVCCNLACDAGCQLCDDPLARGVCLFAQAGTDPGDDCAPGAEACGTTGLCDDQGACALQAAGSECAPASCAAGVRTSPGFCDGSGQCAPGLEHPCPSGACEGDQCAAGQADGGTDDGGDGGDDGGGNQPPRAEAGQVAPVAPGTPVTLDGSQSWDPEGEPLAHAWTQSSGPVQVTLTGSTTPRPSFTPVVLGVYTFELVVSDGELDSLPDLVSVRVESAEDGCGCSGLGAPAGAPGLLAFGLLALARLRGRRRPP
ncbi:MAG TPA: MYXO-CTERM sorting domain-containing protein [Myxococcota bacterium]|nr:MYXO-CTERM sorting domain-containing protein [Myxococcota bacterium]HRY95700.1 MYXO-CTERM sorting domain-containing protein [Myxococcota bacterium]HSA20184.1 MYXO-CTERM sorting domain-containing protein [Myxococcota bacterium]